MDFSTIKAEYIADVTASYRSLAQKYGVSYSAIGSHARKEDWAAAREEYQTKQLSNTLSAMAGAQAARLLKIQTAADKLLDRIVCTIDGVSMETLLEDPQALKKLTGALRDIKDIQMIKSQEDLREQEARIKNLERQAQLGIPDAHVQIEFLDPEKEKYTT